MCMPTDLDVCVLQQGSKYEVAYHDVSLYFHVCITDMLVIIRSLFLIVQFVCYLLLFHVCLSHDGISKVLMGSGDWYHTHIVRTYYEGICGQQ